MKKSILALLMIGVLLSGSPAAAGKKASDGYRAPHSEYVKEEVRVRMVYFQDWNDLVAKHKELTGQDLKEADYSFAKGPARAKLYAFSALIPNSNKCIIYTMDPRVDYKPEFIGHELVHCSMGQWHK